MAVEEYDIATGEQSQAARGVAAHEKVESDVGIRQRLVTWDNAAVAGLLVVLLLGAYFRFTGLNWDQNHHLHPDERFLTDIATRLEPVTDPLAYLRTSESTLNPDQLDRVPFYVYGNFPMTVVVYVASWVNRICQAAISLCAYDYTAYDGIHLLGRFLSGFVDLIAVAFIFLIGRRLYDWRAGLLGALLLSVAVMPIQQSHFFTMDNWAAALCTVTLYMAVRASQDAQR